MAGYPHNPNVIKCDCPTCGAYHVTTIVAESWDGFDRSPRDLEALRSDVYGTEHKPITAERLTGD
jgi:hypothetical protein